MFGITVKASNLLMEFKYVPVRIHEPKGWMSENYHQRIQKKWIKRFGYVKKPLCVNLNGVIYTHPNNMAKISACVSGNVPL
jgi:hypothetical protein